MIELYLMRHGESTAQLHVDRVGGRQNAVELTQLGREQAGKARDYLLRNDIHPTRVYSSLATRAIDTARIVTEREDIITDARFQELSHASFEGRLRTEVYTPEAIAELKKLGMDFRFPGGESTNDVATRVLEGVLDVAQRATDGDILYIASHAVAIKALIARICDYDQQWIYLAISPNVCLTKVTYSNGELHLDPEWQLVDIRNG